MGDRMDAVNNPTWWTDKHASTWDKVKDAFERDWEQTKADFSANNGHKLNQNAADTFSQAVGWAPTPPLSEKTRPTDPKTAVKDVEKARENFAKVDEKAAKTIAEVHGDIAKERQKLDEKVGDVRQDLAKKQADTYDKVADAQVKANEKIADAKKKAAENVAKGQEKIADANVKRAEANRKWEDAENELRYGYSVRSTKPVGTVWDDKLEGSLRGEWDALRTGRSWEESREAIRRGWDYAGKKL